MSRTHRLKLLYASLLVGGFASCGLAMFAFDIGLGSIAATALLFLLPGRIQGVIYRRLFRGIRLLAEERNVEAEVELQAFLRALEARPWIRGALWLQATVYTTSVEAMAWNNIGVSRLGRGEIAGAREAYERALRLDPLYPLPHVGLAAIASARDPDANKGHLATARALGFAGDATDRVVRAGQVTLARIEGRPARTNQEHDPPG